MSKNLIPNAPLFSRTGSAQTVTVLSFTLKIWLEMPVARQTNGTVHSTNLSIFYSVLLTRSHYPLVAVCYIQIFGTSYICPYVGHKNLGALGPHPLGTGIMHDPLETRLSPIGMVLCQMWSLQVKRYGGRFNSKNSQCAWALPHDLLVVGIAYPYSWNPKLLVSY